MGGLAWTEVIEEHAKLCPNITPLAAGTPSAILLAYEIAAAKPFTEDDCIVGKSIFNKFLIRFLHYTLGRKISFETVSGCRASKFSLHVVAKELLVDSVGMSM